MLKIYLDSNIYSDIANELDKPFINKLKDLSEKDVLFLYSQAHLDDLSNDKTEYKIKELDTIEEFACTNFIHQDFKLEQITTTIIQANEAFKLFGENESESSEMFSSVFQETGIEEVDIYLSLLKLQPIDLGEHIENILSREEGDLEKSIYIKIGITKRHYTMGEWILVFEKMIFGLKNDRSLLSTLRRQSKEYLNADKFKLNINDNKFNENLIKSKLGKSFRELLNQQLSHFTQQKNKLYQEFLTCYNTISFMGFDSENNRKVRFRNTLIDAQHCYYAATSDILVSQDKGMLEKAKYLYKFYGIDTMVLNISEFKRYINAFKFVKFTNEKLFIIDLNLKMKQSIIMVENRPIFRYNQLQEVRKLSQKYFGLFNYLAEVNSIDDEDIYVVLYGNCARIGNITFYKEVNHIIDSMNNMLKSQSKNLSEQDINQLKDGSWKGILWESEITTYWLRFNFDTHRLGLQVGPLNYNEIFA